MAKKNNELERVKRQGRIKVMKLIFGLLCAVIIVLYGVGNNVYNSGSGQKSSVDGSMKAEEANALSRDDNTVMKTDGNNNADALNCGSGTQQPFPMVEVPVYLRVDNQGALEWLAEHYWDNWIKELNNGHDQVRQRNGIHSSQSCDEQTSAKNELQERMLTQAFAGYVNVLSQVDYEKACKGVAKLFGRLEENGDRKALLAVMKASEKVLYEPNSPMLNEELYIPVLEGILASELLSGDDKLAYRANYEIVKINRKGTKARDFEYIYITGDGNGKKFSSLYQTKAEYLIVYFNNPGCTSCKEIKQRLSQEMFIRQMIVEKELIILSVYPDEDLQQWKDDFKDFPNEWIYAADPTGSIKDDNRWGIRAIPSLYLLDKDKTVLLKDTSIEAIMEVIISARSK